MSATLNNSKTVLMFPGLDAVLVPTKVHRWLESAAIVQSLEEASEHLSVITGEEESLVTFFATMRRPNEVDQDRILVGLIALQYAIARETSKNMNFDILTGCSHGDLARSVFAECISLQNMIKLAWVCSKLRHVCEEGVNASVRGRGAKLSPSQLAWLETQPVTLSQWTEHHATVAGSSEDIRGVMDRAAKRNLKMHVLLPVPIHSPLMQPLVDQALLMADAVTLSEPNYEIFSSVYVRPLTSVDEIKQEAIDGTVSPIRWMQTIKRLTAEYGVSKLVSVGPGSTLTDWLSTDSNFAGVEVIDAWEVC